MCRFNMNGYQIFVGRIISKCCWMHPQQNGIVDKEKLVKLDKGKHREENPAVIDSSRAFEKSIERNQVVNYNVQEIVVVQPVTYRSENRLGRAWLCKA